MLKEAVFRGLSIALGVVISYIIIEWFKNYAAKKNNYSDTKVVVDSRPLAESSPTQKRNDFLSMYKSNNVF